MRWILWRNVLPIIFLLYEMAYLICRHPLKKKFTSCSPNEFTSPVWQTRCDVWGSGGLLPPRMCSRQRSPKQRSEREKRGVSKGLGPEATVALLCSIVSLDLGVAPVPYSATGGTVQNLTSSFGLQVKPLYNVPLYNVYLFITLHRGMLLLIQIAWIDSPYNVHLLLTYTGCLSQREHCIEVSLLYENGQSPNQHILVTILNPISLSSCTIHFWVELKASKWLCCTQILLVSLQYSFISEIVTWKILKAISIWGFTLSQVLKF
jgi:hypothetical protein